MLNGRTRTINFITFCGGVKIGKSKSSAPAETDYREECGGGGGVCISRGTDSSSVLSNRSSDSLCSSHKSVGVIVLVIVVVRLPGLRCRRAGTYII